MQELTKSSVTYSVTMEDMAAFNLFHFRNSPTIRRMQRRYLIKYSLLMFPIGFCMASFARMPLWPALCVALFGTVSMAAYFLYYQKRGYIPRLRKMVQRLYTEDQNPGVLGEHTLEVDEEGFTDLTAYRHSRYAWGGLVRIEAEPGYTYLYTGSQSAFIIPHQAITDGDFKAVLKQISRHYQPDKTLAR
jgi:hypothetical protein